MPNTFATNNKKIIKSESGFSLIEVMVSVAVFLIFITAVYGLLRIGVIQRTTVTTQNEVIKNARLSLNTIGRDAVNAGFGYSRVGGFAPDNLTNIRMGLPADTDSEQDLMPSIISGNDINTNNLLPTGRTDVVSFIFRDVTFNNGNSIPLTGTGSTDNGGSGVRIPTAAGAAAPASPYDLYFISDGARTALGLVTSVPNTSTLIFATGSADPLGINAPFSGSSLVRSRLRKCPDPQTTPPENDCFDYSSNISAVRVTWVSYSVNADGTLIRTLYGNNTGQPSSSQIQVQPIAYNIQNMQVRYLLRDGTVVDDPSGAGNTQSNLNNIVQIDVTISTRVRIRENGVDTTKIINLNSTFSTKNLNYDIG
jgi:prepilin-type N-terminal cleavage/methylation domain-containing protein